MNKDLRIRNSTVDFLTFAAQNEGNSIEVRFEDDTLWLTQQLMADLFQSSRTNIVEHIRNIYRDQELTESATCRNFRQVRLEGNREVSRELPYYNLDMIIAVGYRVNSKRATEFRQWATAVLRNYAIRGYVIDRKRMENGTFLNQDYFEHLLAEIREIRISERRFYQKITDIYATSIDYSPNAPTTKEFFAKVQNKLHYAVHGRTAAELIVERADSTKEHMGLTTWENAPNGKIVKTDVSIAKNYLKESELEDLGRIVNAYLDLAERRAKRHIPMTMADWALHLDRILAADDMELLKDAGKISAEIAKEHAENEFEKYRVVQDRLFRSDFDKQLELFDAEKDDANKEGIAGKQHSANNIPQYHTPRRNNMKHRLFLIAALFVCVLGRGSAFAAENTASANESQNAQSDNRPVLETIPSTADKNEYVARHKEEWGMIYERLSKAYQSYERKARIAQPNLILVGVPQSLVNGADLRNGAKKTFGKTSLRIVPCRSSNDALMHTLYSTFAESLNSTLPTTWDKIKAVDTPFDFSSNYSSGSFLNAAFYNTEIYIHSEGTPLSATDLKPAFDFATGLFNDYKTVKDGKKVDYLDLKPEIEQNVEEKTEIRFRMDCAFRDQHRNLKDKFWLLAVSDKGELSVDKATSHFKKRQNILTGKVYYVSDRDEGKQYDSIPDLPDTVFLTLPEGEKSATLTFYFISKEGTQYSAQSITLSVPEKQPEEK